MTFFFCNCDNQETGIAGGFWEGGIVLVDEENGKSSGFGKGSVLLNMSVCVLKFAVFKDGFSIVAFRQLGEVRSECLLLK